MKNVTSKLLFIICIILAFLLYQEYQKNEGDYIKPKGLITEKQANDYEENYKDNQYKAINEFLNKNEIEVGADGEIIENNDLLLRDSRAIRFELTELENYIHYVKQEVKKKELDGELSLRIYFGAKLTSFEKQPKNIMRSTLFFVPTHKEITRNPELKHKNISGIKPLNMGSAGDPDDIEYNGGD